MKKLFYSVQIAALALFVSTAVYADGHGHGHHGGWGGYDNGGYGWDHQGWGHHGHHGHHGWGHHGGGRQVNNYYYSQQPQPNYYYQQPPVYYQPQPQYYNRGGYQDRRSHQGLAGGVIGSVFGYELGNGHPLAAGIGAAAGSFLGNGVGWRY